MGRINFSVYSRQNPVISALTDSFGDLLRARRYLYEKEKYSKEVFIEQANRTDNAICKGSFAPKKSTL